MAGTGEFEKIAIHALHLINKSIEILNEIKLTDLYEEKQKEKYMKDILTFAEDMNELMEDYVKRGSKYE